MSDIIPQSEKVIVVVGLGSMGNRRIRIICDLGLPCRIIGIDPSEERRNDAKRLFGIQTHPNIRCISDVNYDVVFIASPPNTHQEIMKIAISKKANVFSELNVRLIDYTDIIKMAKRQNVILFLSSTMLYRKETQIIKELVNNCNSLAAYNYHIGQYLPDWHPWEDYTKFFASKKETNACREILAIELPWLIDAFGDIEYFSKVDMRITKLSIDFSDCLLILVKHTSGICGVLQVDVVSRKCERNFRLVGEELDLSWDGTPSGLSIYDAVNKASQKVNVYENATHIDTYNPTVIENAYYDEVKEFFSVIAGCGSAKYSYEDEIRIMTIINEIEGE